MGTQGSPRTRFVVDPPPSAELLAEIEEIPGVWARRGAILVPDNAVWIVDHLLESRQASFRKFPGSTPPSARNARPALPWLHPMVVEPGFLTSYQREGVSAALRWPNESGLFVWSAGCLSGNTLITINRGGSAKQITLRELVFKFNGGVTSQGGRGGRKWDLSIPTMAQSHVDGAIRLNQVVATYANGINDVFEVATASGKKIRATGQHMFALPDGGWSSLQALRVGESVLVAAWPVKGAQEPAPKAMYQAVEHMWRHPFAVRSYPKRSDWGEGAFTRQARVPEHRLIAEAERNGISFPELVGRIILNRLEGLEFLDPAIWHVHHKNEDPQDNRPDNLEVLAIKDHHAQHGRSDGWRHVSGYSISDEIVSISRVGEEEVFDLGMADPHNNYIANEFVVHNSGKTLAGILWALSAGPAVSIVVTKAAIRPSWDRQIREYTQGVELRSLIGESPDPAILDVAEKRRGGVLPTPVILITGYDTLPAWIGALERLRPARVVFDEIHRAKSHQRWNAEQSWEDEGKVKFSLKDNQAAACLRLSKVARHRLGLTATPIRDRVRDLWAQLDLVRPGDFGGFWPFAKRYCNTPDAPIWMGDYSFRPLGDVKIGDSVIGWIRKHGPRTKKAREPRRVLARSVVTHVQRREAEIVELEMQSGRRIRCTPDHEWLTIHHFGSNVDNPDRDVLIRSAVAAGLTYKQAGIPFGLSVPSVWRVVHSDKTYEYLPAKVGRPLCFVANPNAPSLSQDQTWKAAWLGGVYDGEGHDNFIAQSQKHNPEVFAKIGEALADLGIPAAQAKEGVSCGGWRISGGRDGLLHFQKIVRSVRFPKVADRTMLTGKFRKHPDPVVGIRSLGIGEVISLTTTTGNYVAWGYASKNCAARENPFGGMDTRGSSNLAELQRRLGFVVHSVPHSLANRSLPPARRLVTFIPIAQQVRAEGSRNLIRGALKRGAAGLREALLMEAASRKRKIILDHVLDAIDGKLKIVIFTGRKIDVESIRGAISKKAPGCPLWAATGEDMPEQREVWRLAYMAAPGPAVLVATGESFGEGLDLQDTDLGIMAMLPYTPGQVIQYEGRWVRLGMKRPVEIRYFVAEGTIDEHVSAILLKKLPAIERTVDLDEVRGLTSELAGDESALIASMAAKVLAG